MKPYDKPTNKHIRRPSCGLSDKHTTPNQIAITQSRRRKMVGSHWATQKLDPYVNENNIETTQGALTTRHRGAREGVNRHSISTGQHSQGSLYGCAREPYKDNMYTGTAKELWAGMCGRHAPYREPCMRRCRVDQRQR